MQNLQKSNALRSSAGILERIEFTWREVNQNISKDANGLFNLTEVHKAGEFSENKKPGQWARSNQHFIDRQTEKCRSANMHNAFEVKKGGSVQGTWGNHRILQKYLQWLSPDYEDVVLDAIEALGSGKVESTPQITKATDSKMAASWAAYVREAKVFTKVKSAYLVMADQKFVKKYGFSMINSFDLTVEDLMQPNLSTVPLITNTESIPDVGFFSIENLRPQIHKKGFCDIAMAPLRKICIKLNVKSQDCKKYIENTGQYNPYKAYSLSDTVEKLTNYIPKCKWNDTETMLIDSDGLTFFYRVVIGASE